MNAITIENVTKKYNDTEILKDISLQIAQGEFYSLMGPNGSGKTTLVSIIASVRSPTSGIDQPRQILRAADRRLKPAV